MLYMLLIYGDVSPEIRGPFKTERGRVQAARKYRAGRQDRGGLFRLDINPDACPGYRVRVGSFSGGELER